MVALCGRGGAGRDGDVELRDRGWLGAAGLLTEVLTDLEFKERSYVCCLNYLSIFCIKCSNKRAPELLHWVLFTGKKQPLESLSLDADN